MTFSFFFFLLTSAPRPQTTLESTVINGRTFEHVEQVGKGFPSGPCGMFGFGDALGVSCTAREGRARSTRVSTSSFLTVSSSLVLSLLAPFWNLAARGVAVGVGVALPLPLLSLSIMEDADRVSRLEGSALQLGEAFVGLALLPFPSGTEAGARDSDFALCWRRVAMMERNGVDWLLLGVERLVDDVNSVREDDKGDAPSLRLGVMRSGVACFAGLEPSEGGEEVASDVNSDPVSSSAMSSISPSPCGVPTGSSSSSLSLSSLSFSLGLVTAYTPRRVRRSLMFKSGFFSGRSLSASLEDVSESESESDPEPELESELDSGSSL